MNHLLVARTLFATVLVSAMAASQSFPVLKDDQTLLSPGTPGEDWGRRIATANESILVFVPNEGSGVIRSYEPGPSGYSLSQTILPPPAGSSFFEGDLAADGDTFVVGGGPSPAGHLFHVYRNTGGWQLEATVTGTKDHAAGSLAIDGDRFVATVPDYDLFATQGQIELAVFVRTGSTWSEEARIPWTQGSFEGIGLYFLPWLGISGDRIVVSGVLNWTFVGPIEYDSRVFLRSGSQWTSEATVLMPNGTPAIGSSYSLEDDRLAISAGGDVLLFQRLDTTWPLTEQLTAPIGFAYGEVENADGLLLVQALEIATQTRQIRTFRWDGTPVTQVAALEPSSPAGLTSYGVSLAVLPGGGAVVGAPSTLQTPGRVHVYDRVAPEAYCTAKVSVAGCVGQLDLSPPWLPLSQAATHDVVASQVEGQRVGLVIYSHQGVASTPFFGGTLCLQAPLSFGPPTRTAGTPGSCDGSMQLGANDGVSGLDQGPGSEVWAQAWYRDPVADGGTGAALTNALAYNYWN